MFILKNGRWIKCNRELLVWLTKSLTNDYTLYKNITNLQTHFINCSSLYKKTMKKHDFCVQWLVINDIISGKMHNYECKWFEEKIRTWWINFIFHHQSHMCKKKKQLGVKTMNTVVYLFMLKYMYTVLHVNYNIEIKLYIILYNHTRFTADIILVSIMLL